MIILVMKHRTIEQWWKYREIEIKKGTSRFKFSRWGGGGGGDGDGGNSRHWSRMGLIQEEFSAKMFPIYKNVGWSDQMHMMFGDENPCLGSLRTKARQVQGW